MKIALDVDVALTEMNSFLRVYGKKFFRRMGKTIKEPKATSIELMYGANAEESHRFWNRYFVKYCLSVDFRPNLKTALEQLKAEKNELHVVTARFGANWNNIIGKLIRYLLIRKFKQQQIAISSYTFTNDDIKNDKVNACIANHFDTVVEDNPTHIQAIIEKMGIPVIVVTTPENEALHHDKIIRITDLSELPLAVKCVQAFYENQKSERMDAYAKKLKTGKPSVDRPWEKEYIALGIREYLTVPESTKFDFWRMRNKWYPDEIAYVYCYGKRFKNADYEKLVYDCAKSLSFLGVRMGTIVTAIAANLVEYKIVDEACNMLGAILNVIHPFTKYEELKKRMENLDKEKDTKILFVLSNAYEVLQTKGNLHNFAEKIIILNPKDSMTMKGMIEFLYDEKKKKGSKPAALQSAEKKKIQYSADVLKFKTFMLLGKNIQNLEVAPADLDRPTKILYTGGTTTDKPKGVVLTDRNYLSMIVGYEMLANFNRGEVMNTVTPVFHGFGDCNCTDMPKAFGVAVDLSPSFNSYNFIRNIRKYEGKRRVNIMCTPTLFTAISKNEEFGTLSGCDFGYLCTGGALLTNENKNLLEKAFHHEFTVGYGATETLASSLFTFMPDEQEGYIGIPLPGANVKIVNPGTEDELSYHMLGEICISGRFLFKEYYNNPEATKAVLRKHSDGIMWYHSGDLGEIDENGHVIYKTRLDDCVTYNGYNVYLDDIDTALEKHDWVEEAMTVSVDDLEHGNLPVSCVKVADGITDSHIAEKLLSYLKSTSLPMYSIPKQIIIVEEIPKSVYGKKSRPLMKQKMFENAKGGR